MKKVLILFLFIVSVLIAYFVTKSISGKSASDDISEEPIEYIDSFEVIGDTIDTIVVDPIVTPDPSPVDPIIVPKPEPGPNVPDNPEPIKKRVNISLSEMKQLIQSGTYDKDKRIAKKYSIEYEDVSDDDVLEGLQQNFTFIQQRVEFETWRDFEVIGLDYDEQSGLVNLVKIRPIY